MATPAVVPAQTDGTGAGVAIISHNLQNIIWRISQISVGAGGAVVTTNVDVNGQPCTSSVTGVTPLAAHGVPPIDIGGHDLLHVNVYGGPANASISVSYFYDELPA